MKSLGGPQHRDPDQGGQGSDKRQAPGHGKPQQAWRKGRRGRGQEGSRNCCTLRRLTGDAANSAWHWPRAAFALGMGNIIDGQRPYLGGNSMKRFAFALAATFVLAVAGPALADPIIIKFSHVVT